MARSWNKEFQVQLQIMFHICFIYEVILLRYRNKTYQMQGILIIIFDNKLPTKIVKTLKQLIIRILINISLCLRNALTKFDKQKLSFNNNDFLKQKASSLLWSILMLLLIRPSRKYLMLFSSSSFLRFVHIGVIWPISSSQLDETVLLRLLFHSHCLIIRNQEYCFVPGPRQLSIFSGSISSGIEYCSLKYYI